MTCHERARRQATRYADVGVTLWVLVSIAALTGRWV